MIGRFKGRGAVALAAVAALVAGCGGGGSDSSTQAAGPAPEPLTRAQFVKRGDAICQKDYIKRTSELGRYLVAGGESLPQAKKEQAVLKVIVPTFGHDVEGLEELAARSAPKGEEAKVEAIVDAFRTVVRRIEEAPGSILGGSEPLFAKLEKLTDEYGFNRCGKS